MIITLLVVVGLLAISTSYLGYRQFTDRRWEQRAERARVDREIRRAERKLHGIASNTFAAMMSAARRSSGGCEWHR